MRTRSRPGRAGASPSFLAFVFFFFFFFSGALEARGLQPDGGAQRAACRLKRCFRASVHLPAGFLDKVVDFLDILKERIQCFLLACVRMRAA